VLRFDETTVDGRRALSDGVWTLRSTPLPLELLTTSDDGGTYEHTVIGTVNHLVLTETGVTAHGTLARDLDDAIIDALREQRLVPSTFLHPLSNQPPNVFMRDGTTVFAGGEIAGVRVTDARYVAWTGLHFILEEEE